MVYPYAHFEVNLERLWGILIHKITPFIFYHKLNMRLEEQHTTEWVNFEVIYMCSYRVGETEWEGSHMTPSTRK
jgi:hypothetical protein